MPGPFFTTIHKPMIACCRPSRPLSLSILNLTWTVIESTEAPTQSQAHTQKTFYQSLFIYKKLVHQWALVSVSDGSQADIVSLYLYKIKSFLLVHVPFASPWINNLHTLFAFSDHEKRIIGIPQFIFIKKLSASAFLFIYSSVFY